MSDYLRDVIIRDDGSIVPKWRSFKRWVTGITIVVFLCLFVAAGVYVQTMLDANEQRETIVNNTISESLSGKTTTFTKAIAKIVTREGKLSEATGLAYTNFILSAAAKYRVDPILIMSIIYVESKFDYSVVSKGNAIGLMQIVHSSHPEKSHKNGLFDPENNINVGTKIIAEYAAKSGSVAETLLRYNGSLGTAPAYAVKVMDVKKRFQEEVFSGVIKS